MRSRWLAVFLVTSALLIAEAGVAVGVTSLGQAPAGYRTVAADDASFSIAVPRGWLILNPRSKSFARSLSSLAAANPKLGPVVAEVQANASSIVLFAVDATSTADVSPTLNGVELPIDESELSDVGAVQDALRAQVPDLVVSKTTVAGTHALVGAGTLTLNRPDGTPASVHETVYLVPSDVGVLEVTFSTADDGLQNAQVQTMIQTLQLDPVPGSTGKSSTAAFCKLIAPIETAIEKPATQTDPRQAGSVAGALRSALASAPKQLKGAMATMEKYLASVSSAGNNPAKRSAALKGGGGFAKAAIAFATYDGTNCST
jgi:hypothetical protein